MGSAIDTTKPAAGTPTTQSVRDNFSAAKAEIEALQSGSGIASGAIGATKLSDNAVTFPKMQDIATDRLIGRDAAASGDPEEIALDATLEFTGAAGIRRAALTGDVTASAGSNATSIAGNAVTNAKLANAYIHDLALVAAAAGDHVPLADASDGNSKKKAPVSDLTTESLIVACSDETTALTAGTAKVTFRMPFAFTLTGIRGSLCTAQTAGGIFTVDVNESGSSILSTKITIDNGEKTSTSAAAPPVLSDSALADDAEITIDIDQIGDGTAKGLKVALIGYRL